MSAKQLLKEARKAITENDPETALASVREVLSLDNQNYFAYLFRGKAYLQLNNIDKALVAYERSIEIDPKNLLGWKGYFQAAQDLDDYRRYFDILTRYVRVLSEEELSYTEAINEALRYLNKHKYQLDYELREFFLRSVLPDTELGFLVGSLMGQPLDNLQKLISLVQNKESTETRSVLAKERMKMPRVLTQALQSQLDAYEWEVCKRNDLSNLYQLFLNICQDDDLRKEYEVRFFKYKYRMLKFSPEKDRLRKEISEMAADMTLIGTSEILVWSVHFDLQDPASLYDYDQDQLLSFARNFKNEGLGRLVKAYLISEISPCEKDAIRGLFDPSSEALDSEVIDLDGVSVDPTSNQNQYSGGEVLAMMLEGYSKSETSMLANRIICTFYIHLQEYEVGSVTCAKAIRRLAEFHRSFGIDLQNCKRDILCALATVYTYHEAPKNFARALQLFDKVLDSTPENLQALIGKGLILLEKLDLVGSRELLEKVVRAQPEDANALTELGWCLVLSKEYEKGRETLLEALKNIRFVSGKASLLAATVNWRLAKCVLLEKPNLPESANIAHDYLVESLRHSSMYAPSYTLLGLIYQNYRNDNVHAQKCFYRAFEIDASEIVAAKYLVANFAQRNEWDVTDILCQRVTLSDKSRRMLLSQHNEDSDRSWPYRVLGCSALNKQNDAKAIEWFQTALRMLAMDQECWMGLGEAYRNCGRMDAAIKVFRKLCTSETVSWASFYMLGLSLCESGDFINGIEKLRNALSLDPKQECILVAIGEHTIYYSQQLLTGGFITRTMSVVRTAIEQICDCIRLNPSSQKVWKALIECLQITSSVQFDVEKLPFQLVIEVIDGQENAEIDQISIVRIRNLLNEKNFLEAVLLLQVLAARAALNALPKAANKLLRSMANFNLGITYLNLDNTETEIDYGVSEASVDCLKAAIQIESHNAELWLALGNAYVKKNTKLAQHCYIKASVLDQRSIIAWTNLAALYLRCGDTALASEAFDRATSVAPELSHSWLGNALTSTAMGDEKSASRLTTHAYVLSNGRSPLAMLCYAWAVVRIRVGNSPDSKQIEAAQEFGIANYAINNFLKFSPNDEVGMKLALNLSERCQSYEAGVLVADKICSILESKYEISELVADLVEYSKAKSALARMHLAVEAYELSLDSAQFAQELLTDIEESTETRKIQLSCHIVTALSFFFNSQFDEALEELQNILRKHSDSHRAITLIAQILHAYDTDSAKQAATEQLFSYIEENGSSLMVVLVLGAISVSENLIDLLEPIKEELQGLAISELQADISRSVPKLLSEINSMLSSGQDLRVWQRFACMFPNDHTAWQHLSPSMALSLALLSDSKHTAKELSEAYLAKGTLRETQRALILDGHNPRAAVLLQSGSLPEL